MPTPPDLIGGLTALIPVGWRDFVDFLTEAAKERKVVLASFFPICILCIFHFLGDYLTPRARSAILSLLAPTTSLLLTGAFISARDSAARRRLLENRASEQAPEEQLAARDESDDSSESSSTTDEPIEGSVRARVLSQRAERRSSGNVGQRLAAQASKMAPDDYQPPLAPNSATQESVLSVGQDFIYTSSSGNDASSGDESVDSYDNEPPALRRLSPSSTRNGGPMSYSSDDSDDEQPRFSAGCDDPEHTGHAVHHLHHYCVSRFGRIHCHDRGDHARHHHFGNRNHKSVERERRSTVGRLTRVHSEILGWAQDDVEDLTNDHPSMPLAALCIRRLVQTRPGCHCCDFRKGHHFQHWDEEVPPSGHFFTRFQAASRTCSGCCKNRQTSVSILDGTGEAQQMNDAPRQPEKQEESTRSCCRVAVVQAPEMNDEDDMICDACHNPFEPFEISLPAPVADAESPAPKQEGCGCGCSAGKKQGRILAESPRIAEFEDEVELNDDSVEEGSSRTVDESSNNDQGSNLTHPGRRLDSTSLSGENANVVSINLDPSQLMAFASRFGHQDLIELLGDPYLQLASLTAAIQNIGIEEFMAFVSSIGVLEAKHFLKNGASYLADMLRDIGLPTTAYLIKSLGGSTLALLLKKLTLYGVECVLHRLGAPAFLAGLAKLGVEAIASAKQQYGIEQVVEYLANGNLEAFSSEGRDVVVNEERGQHLDDEGQCGIPLRLNLPTPQEVLATLLNDDDFLRVESQAVASAPSPSRCDEHSFTSSIPTNAEVSPIQREPSEAGSVEPNLTSRKRKRQESSSDDQSPSPKRRHL